MVELMGNPANEWRFVEWTGDLETEDNPEIITIDGPKNISALFEFGFNEDFEDGTAQNWLFSDGKFVNADGKLKYFIDKDMKSASAYYDKSFKNFKFETRVSQTSQKNKSIVTIIVRSNGFLVQDDENEILAEGYFLVFQPTVGVLIAKSEQNGDVTETDILHESLLDLEPGRTVIIQ